MTIAANASGNPRIDAIVLYLNLSASPNTQATNVAGFYDVQGTPAGSPVAPNNAAILAAIGSGNPYIVLAYVAVANGFISISSGNITDERSFASFSTGNVVPVPSYEEFTNQSSDPSSPASGKLRFYSKSDNNLYSKNSSGAVTPVGTDTVFTGEFSNFVASGLTAPTSGTLATTIAAGVAYYGGQKYSVATDGGHTYTASKDTYVDINPASGAYTYSAVANNAAAPALTASSIRIAKVVTSGSAVTSVVQNASVDSQGNVLAPSLPLSETRFDGWQAAQDTWTYASATTFTISGVDRTNVLFPGTKVRLSQSGALAYFVVAASSFSTNTTVTITGGTDYTLANATIVNPCYSYVANPQGYPQWFSWTASTFTGFSSAPSTPILFSVQGRTCTLLLDLVGTSNSATFNFTLPILAAQYASAHDPYLFMAVTVFDNGAIPTGMGIVGIPFNDGTGSVAKVGLTLSTAYSDVFGGFTASSAKGIFGSMQYAI